MKDVFGEEQWGSSGTFLLTKDVVRSKKGLIFFFIINV